MTFLFSIMEGSFALNPMVNTHKYKLLGKVNPGSIFLSVFEQAFSIDLSTMELGGVSQSVDLGQNNNPNTTPTKDYKNV